MNTASLHPNELRKLIRENKFTTHTSGSSEGYIQANVAILPKNIATDFKKFCDLNHAPCPVLEMLEPGQYTPKKLIDDTSTGDVRTDIPKYRVYKNGDLIGEVNQVKDLWRDDLVTFFLGCSFSFERALQQAGIPIRNIDEKKNVSMYKTNIQCKPAGPFHCPLVVSMRPIKKELVDKAIKITAQFTDTHGAPVHVGDPAAIGIKDINKVDFGEAVTIKEGEVPVFWACGVTAIMAAISAKADLTITHSPGHMFVTDLKEPVIKL